MRATKIEVPKDSISLSIVVLLGVEYVHSITIIINCSITKIFKQKHFRGLLSFYLHKILCRHKILQGQFPPVPESDWLPTIGDLAMRQT